MQGGVGKTGWVEGGVTGSEAPRQQPPLNVSGFWTVPSLESQGLLLAGRRKGAALCWSCDVPGSVVDSPSL